MNIADPMSNMSAKTADASSTVIVSIARFMISRLWEADMCGSSALTRLTIRFTIAPAVMVGSISATRSTLEMTCDRMSSISRVVNPCRRARCSSVAISASI